jgi:hypothetical protein
MKMRVAGSSGILDESAMPESPGHSEEKGEDGRTNAISI